MIVYASDSDLPQPPPGNADILIRRASQLVTRALACDYYQVDSGGVPLDPVAKQACSDATCAQVAAWVALGIDPTLGAAGSQGRTPTSSKILDATVTYAAPSSATLQARADAATGLCDDAVDILQAVGLARGKPFSR